VVADRRAYRVTTIDDLEPVPWKPGLSLRPIRSTLRLRAFGAGVYVADKPGDLVIAPHRESDDGGLGHEELYVVLRGTVRFAVDRDNFDAREGHFVAVDPDAHREAVAATAGATVLVVGGPPDRTPAGHEYMARVRAAQNDPGHALSIAEAGLDELPDSPAVHYAMALALAYADQPDRAADWLDRAIGEVPDLEREAATDPALDLLHRRGRRPSG
jgi:hypothetical protein